MNLHFVHPGILYGLMACSIPIIIHLIFRKRYKRVQWAAMKFLLAAYKNTKRSLLLENLLLLLLRILLLALLVFLFARPIARTSSKISSSRASENYIIILDTSYSMNVRGANVSPFEKAKKRGQTIISKVQKKDTISVMLMNEHPQMLFSFNSVASEKRRSEISQRFDEVKVSELGTNVESAIEMLKQLASQKEYRNLHVYILSDFQKHAWKKAIENPSVVETLGKIRKEVISFTLVDVSIKTPENLGIVRLESEGIIGVGRHARFIATIKNYGSKTYVNTPVNFYINGKKQKTDYVTISGKQEEEVSYFPNFIESGNHYITVELEVDNLINDNQRHLSFQVLKQIKILVIDGDPKDEEFESETDYLMAAIGTNPQGIIQTKKITIGDLTPQISFDDFHIVILANLQTFDDERRFAKLEDFVEKGGGLFVWLGDNVQADYYNQELFKAGRELLPGELSGSAIGKIFPEKEKTIFSLEEISESRIWKFFHLNNRLMTDLKKCYIYKFFPVKVDAEDNTVNVLARYNTPGKHPAIIERKFGKGKVVLSTTTLDRKWNNFHADQYGHVFVILIHEFIRYLVSRPLDENNSRVGLPIIKKYDFFIQDAQVTPPDGATSRPKLEPLSKGAAYRVYYDNTQDPGVYKMDFTIPPQILEEKEDINIAEYFILNVDPKEGDITSLSQKDLQEQLRSVKLDYKRSFKKGKKKVTKKDHEYWHEIVWILLIFTFLESLLAMLFGRYNK